MKHLITICLALMIGACISSCSVDSLEGITASQAIGQDAKGKSMNRNFQAHLSSKEEVPMNKSKATGQSIFQLSKDGTELSYKLIVANIEDVRMAHIHLAPAGQNGGVVAWLYPSGPPPQLIPGRYSGILAEGVIQESNLIGITMEELLAAMRSGGAYVNVHTLAFPGGEIRGQIK